MTFIGWFQILIYIAIVFALTKPFGTYMHKVFEGERTWLSPVLGPLERFIYSIGGVKSDEDMPWTTYTLAMLLFSAVTLLVTYVILRLQGILPLNPMGFSTGKAPLCYRNDTGFGVQHGGVLHHEHQLAELLTARIRCPISRRWSDWLRTTSFPLRSASSSLSPWSEGCHAARRRRSAISGSTLPVARCTYYCRFA